MKCLHSISHTHTCIHSVVPSFSRSLSICSLWQQLCLVIILASFSHTFPPTRTQTEAPRIISAYTEEPIDLILTSSMMIYDTSLSSPSEWAAHSMIRMMSIEQISKKRRTSAHRDACRTNHQRSDKGREQTTMEMPQLKAIRAARMIHTQTNNDDAKLNNHASQIHSTVSAPNHRGPDSVFTNTLLVLESTLSTSPCTALTSTTVDQLIPRQHGSTSFSSLIGQHLTLSLSRFLFLSSLFFPLSSSHAMHHRPAYIYRYPTHRWAHSPCSQISTSFKLHLIISSLPRNHSFSLSFSHTKINFTINNFSTSTFHNLCIIFFIKHPHFSISLPAPCGWPLFFSNSSSTNNHKTRSLSSLLSPLSLSPPSIKSHRHTRSTTTFSAIAFSSITSNRFM